jgi:hypothetical protein
MSHGISFEAREVLFDKVFNGAEKGVPVEQRTIALAKLIQDLYVRKQEKCDCGR